MLWRRLYPSLGLELRDWPLVGKLWVFDIDALAVVTGSVGDRVMIRSGQLSFVLSSSIVLLVSSFHICWSSIVFKPAETQTYMYNITLQHWG